MNKFIKKLFFLKNRNSKFFQCAKLVIRNLPISFQRLINRYRYLNNSVSIPHGEDTHVFTNIYKFNQWGSHESKSGPGSTLKATAVIRKQLPLIIEKYAIQSMLDVPCGDYNWMKTVEKTCSYIGGDIVMEVIENNQKLYASEKSAI
jgi:hypothetical protein